EAVAVPVGIRDQVDRDPHPERPRALERLEVLAEGDALAILAQALLVDRLEPQEHVLEAQALPETEDLDVAQEHVAARLQVVLLTDSLSRDRLAEAVAVFGLNEGDVVDDEDARL